MHPTSIRLIRLLLFAGAFGVAALSAAAPIPSNRIVVHKKFTISEDGGVVYTPVRTDLLAAAGYSTLADYGTTVVFKGPSDSVNRAMQELAARGLDAELATELDTYSFHDRSLSTDSSGSAAELARPGLFFVSLDSYPTDAWIAELQRSSTIIQTLPPATYLVRVRTSGSALLAFPFVRSVRPLTQDLKIVGLLAHAATDGTYSRISVAVAEDAPEESLREFLESRAPMPVYEVAREEGRATYISNLVDVDVPVLLAHDRVYEVAPVGDASLAMERQAQLIAQPTGGGASLPATNNTTYLTWLSTKGFTIGANVFDNTKVGIIDEVFDNGDFNSIHPDFTYVHNSTTYKLIAPADTSTSWFGSFDDRSNHGTVVASIVAGYPSASRNDGTGYLFGLGVAPTVRLAIHKNFSCQVAATDGLGAWVTAISAKGAQVINLSYNVDQPVGCGYTSTESQVVDERTRTQNLLFTIAAGNSTPGGCSPNNYVRAPGTAKNSLTMGATDNYTLNWPTITTGSTCAWNPQGPSQDARRIPSFSAFRNPSSVVKPDLVAPATRITGPQSRGPDCADIFCNNTVATFSNPSVTYGMSSGTSFAAPAAAGAAAVVRKWFRNRYFFDPSPAQTKAILINGARDIQGTIVRDQNYGTVASVGYIPDKYQGWGMLSFERLFGANSEYYNYDQGTTLTSSGQTWTASPAPVVNNGAKDIHVTLVWSDPPSVAASTYTVVNDLNLLVCGGAPQKCFQGNHFSNGVTLPRPPAPIFRDSVNNVERVRIQAGTFPTGTALTVQVKAFNTPQPGGQNFAIAMENAHQ
jgi:hypothetical protein